MLKRMFESRLRVYRAIGYARSEAPFALRGDAASNVEQFVEYDRHDEEVLRAYDHEAATDWGDDCEDLEEWTDQTP